MHLTKRKIKFAIFAFWLSLIILGGTSLLVLQLLPNSNLEPSYKNPLNRGDNYHLYDLTSYLSNDDNLSSIVKTNSLDNNSYINEEDLNTYLTKKFRNILASIDQFKSKASEYKICFYYKLEDENKTALIDVVWNLPNSDYYYFDQIKIEC